PLATENAADVRVRFMTGNAASSDEWVGIDDLRITAVDALEVPENVTIGSTVYTAVGIDPEAGALTCAITSGNAEGRFAINSNTGAITTLLNLDFETTPAYQLTVQATDTEGLS